MKPGPRNGLIALGVVIAVVIWGIWSFNTEQEQRDQHNAYLESYQEAVNTLYSDYEAFVYLNNNEADLEQLSEAVETYARDYDLFVSVADEYYSYLSENEDDLWAGGYNVAQMKIGVQQSKIAARQNRDAMRTYLEELAAQKQAYREIFLQLIGLLV